MAVHFDKSHYACKDIECQQRGFIAFKEKSELVNHKFKDHGIGQGKVIVRSKDPNAHNTLKDKEGVDFSHQVFNFISNRLEIALNCILRPFLTSIAIVIEKEEKGSQLGE